MHSLRTKLRHYLKRHLIILPPPERLFNSKSFRQRNQESHLEDLYSLIRVSSPLNPPSPSLGSMFIPFIVPSQPHITTVVLHLLPFVIVPWNLFLIKPFLLLSSPTLPNGLLSKIHHHIVLPSSLLYHQYHPPTTLSPTHCCYHGCTQNPSRL